MEEKWEWKAEKQHMNKIGRKKQKAKKKWKKEKEKGEGHLFVAATCFQCRNIKSCPLYVSFYFSSIFFTLPVVLIGCRGNNSGDGG